MGTSSSQARMGGRRSLRIFLKGGADVVDSLLSLSEGGAKLTRGLLDRVADAYGEAFDVEVRHEAGGGSAQLLKEVRAAAATVRAAGAADQAPVASGILEARPSVVVLSFDPEHDGNVGAFGRNMREAVQVLKNDLEAHVIAFNASTVDPADDVSNYRGTAETDALRLHRLNLALMRLSVDEGISIIDVDRLLADIGAGTHVQGVLDYSSEACGLICDEFLRVLADYGFFERRPLVAQLGRDGQGSR